MALRRPHAFRPDSARFAGSLSIAAQQNRLAFLCQNRARHDRSKHRRERLRHSIPAVLSGLGAK